MPRVKLAVTLALVAATAALAGDDVIKRGATVSDGPVLALADVVLDAASYSGKTVILEARVGRVCQAKGCWMGLVADSTSGARVTFKDYGFFVPTNASGLIAKIEGTVHTKTLSKDEADHLESEGAKLTRNADGTVTEVNVVASGVELRSTSS